MKILEVKSNDIIVLKGDSLILKQQKEQIEKALQEQGITNVKCITLNKDTDIEVIRRDCSKDWIDKLTTKLDGEWLDALNRSKTETTSVMPLNNLFNLFKKGEVNDR